MSQVVTAIALCIAVADSLDDLADWWRAHQPVLRGLSPAELAEVTALKDRRKAELMHRQAHETLR